MNPAEVEAIASTANVIMLSAPVEECLRILHIIGISMGLGGSLFADYLSFDMLMLPGRNSVLEGRTMNRIHWFIFAGLGMIWFSGICIALNKFTWSTIPNKLVVKIIVVTALSVNAVLIGRYLVPISKKYQSPLLRFMSKKEIKISALIISVSITCWFSALFVSKFIALQQMSISLLLFVIGSTYLLLFIAIHGFLNYAKSVLLSNVADSNVADMPASQTPLSDGIHGYTQVVEKTVEQNNNRPATAAVPPTLTQPLRESSPRNTEPKPAPQVAEPEGSSLTPAAQSGYAFAKGMAFQYSPHFASWVMDKQRMNFSKIFPDPQAKFPWFDALEISNQMSQVKYIKATLTQQASARSSATDSSTAHSRHILSSAGGDRTQARRYVLTEGDVSRAQAPMDSTVASPAATNSPSSSEASPTPKPKIPVRRNLVESTHLRGKTPLISQPALS